jgi:hypothetical protein
MKAIVMIEWLYLVIQDDGRSEVAGTTHDREILAIVGICGYFF